MHIHISCILLESSQMENGDIHFQEITMTAIKNYGSTCTSSSSSSSSSSNKQEVSPLLLRTKNSSTDRGEEFVSSPSPSSRRAFAAAAASILLVVALVSLLFLATSKTTFSRSSSSSSSNDDTRRNSWLVFWNPLYRKSHPGHRHKLTIALNNLDNQLTGKVYYRQDDSFDKRWPVWNQAITIPPFAVIETKNAQDVALTVPVLIELESEYGIPFAIKSGGHNFAGWSSVPNGVVLSLRKLKSFDLQIPDDNENDTAIATMGPGTSDGDILKQGLLEHGYAGVVGSSSAVCMGGWMLGGGVGYWSRRYGLGIDNVIAMDIVLADGTMVTATDTNDYADLFWALRGAGQATFGVVTGYQYKMYPAQDEMLLVTGHLPYHLAAHALTKLGLAEPDLPGSIFVEVGSDDQGLVMSFFCLSETEQILEDCKGAIGDYLHNTLPKDVADGFSYDRTSWYQSALEETAELEGFLVRDWNGFLLRKENDFENWSVIMDALNEFKGNPYILFDIELWGGAVNEVNPGATAYPWRDALYSVGILVLVPRTANRAGSLYDEMVDSVNTVWKHNIQDLLEGMFVNYAMKSLEADPKVYAQAAWGKNLERLKEIKAKYDPDDCFHSALDILV